MCVSLGVCEWLVWVSLSVCYCLIGCYLGCVLDSLWLWLCLLTVVCEYSISVYYRQSHKGTHPHPRTQGDTHTATHTHTHTHTHTWYVSQYGTICHPLTFHLSMQCETPPCIASPPSKHPSQASEPIPAHYAITMIYYTTEEQFYSNKTFPFEIQRNHDEF